MSSTSLGVCGDTMVMESTSLVATTSSLGWRQGEWLLVKRVSTTTRLCCTPTAKRDWVLKRIAEGRFGSEDLWCLSITLPRDATGFPAMASTGLWPTTRRAISFLSWRSLYNILKIVWNLPTRSIDCFQGDGNAALRLISERAFRLSQIILKLCSRFRSSERRLRCDFSRVASS
jgi:hypothetical protein